MDQNLINLIFQDPYIFSKFLIHCSIKECIWPLVSSSWLKFYNESYYKDLLDFNFPNHEKMLPTNMKKKDNNPKFKNKFLLAYEQFLIPDSDIFNKAKMNIQRFYLTYKEFFNSEPLMSHPNISLMTKSFLFHENHKLINFVENSDVEIKHLFIVRLAQFDTTQIFNNPSLKNLKSVELSNTGDYDSFTFDHPLLEKLTLYRIHEGDIYKLPNLRYLIIKEKRGPLNEYSKIFPMSKKVKKINSSCLYLKEKLEYLESFEISSINFRMSDFSGVKLKKIVIICDHDEDFIANLDEVNLSLKNVKNMKFLISHTSINRIFNLIDQTKIYDKLKILGESLTFEEIFDLSRFTKHLSVEVSDGEFDNITNTNLERLDLSYYGTDIKTISNLVPNFRKLEKFSLKLNPPNVRLHPTLFSGDFIKSILLNGIYSPKITKIPFDNTKITVDNHFMCIFSAISLLKTNHKIDILNVRIDFNLNEGIISDFCEALSNNKIKILKLNCHPGPYLDLIFEKVDNIIFRRINTYNSFPSDDFCLKSRNVWIYSGRF